MSAGIELTAVPDLSAAPQGLLRAISRGRGTYGAGEPMDPCSCRTPQEADLTALPTPTVCQPVTGAVWTSVPTKRARGAL